MSDTGFRVDLTNCDREPIHILGAVQPFGFLLALSADWLIARASANAGAFVGRDAAALIGTPLIDLFTADAVHALRNRLSLLRGEDAVERLLGQDLQGDGRQFDVALHFVGGQPVIEAEPAQADHGDAGGTVRGMMGRLDAASDMTAFFREGARQVRALTGFDRVMVYRFDERGSGEVVGEAVRPGFGSFLGLHYPASDIPQQARTLYLRNLFRIIADVGAEPVPILPQRDERGRPLDLSLSVLRAVSPIHIEYLTNMGVAASLSISIVIDGKLWGLFACHHYAPRLPPLERRSLAELFGQMFAMKLESRERQAMAEYAANGRAVADRLLASVAGDASLLDDPSWLAEMLGEAIASDGVGVHIDGRVALSGFTPDEAGFREIVAALQGTAAGRVHATDRIADFVPGAASARAAGMLALPISRRPRDYVVLFREEIVRTVRWGGDPHKPTEFGPNGPRLTPRKSFETWSELVRGSSRPFTPAEIRVAETLRGTLIEVILRLSDEAHFERQIATERQELLIAELNHRVRNILSLIRGLVRQSRSASGSIEDYVRELDGRIHALARAHNQITSDHWGPAPLKALIETEAAAYLAGQSNRVHCDGPDVLLAPQAFATLALVFHELVTNSAKYGGLSDSGRVDVTWRLDEEGDLLIDWRERGGPPVQAPTRVGFGSTIIRRSVPYDLGGAARIHYHLAGVEAHFCVPARHVSKGVGTQVAVVPTPSPSPDATEVETLGQPLAGRSVLLVEDNLIIAMDAEDVLTQLGAAQVVPAASVRQALQEIEAATPDFALLDINLGDETSFRIAERLTELGVPFLFATGYGDQAQLPAAFAELAVIQKPYTIGSVARLVGA